jgi:hypothetical protein
MYLVQLDFEWKYLTSCSGVSQHNLKFKLSRSRENKIVVTLVSDL